MHKKQAVSFVILSILILACQAGGLLVTPTLVVSPTATVPTLTATKTLTPTRTPSPTATAFLGQLDYKVTIVAGGFSMSPIRGYEKDVSTYQAFLSSKDEKVNIFLLTQPRPHGKLPFSEVKSYMEYFKTNIHDFSEGEGRDVTIDSAEGYSKDYTGTLKEELLTGRITIVYPEDSKILIIIMTTLGEGRWESEGELAYSSLVGSISFFKPKISDACPIAKNKGYGFSIDVPIKIGGGESNGPDREEEYLSGLLGPHGEIVDFYRDESIEHNGVIIDKYIISYGDTHKTLFMDIYSYDDPEIPFGIACSTVYPLTPP